MNLFAPLLWIVASLEQKLFLTVAQAASRMASIMSDQYQKSFDCMCCCTCCCAVVSSGAGRLLI
jgi:hypothetical protein